MLLICLPFLFSAGRVIGIALGVSSYNDLGRDQNRSTPMQAPRLSGAIPRGYRSPLPFDEDVFDPTHVSNEITNVLSKYGGAADRFAGITLGTSNVPTPNVSIPLPNVLRSNVMPLNGHFERNLDLLYYGEIRVGTPAQSLTVQVDTGSADLWVPANCPKCTGKQFKPGQSHTYQGKEGTFEEHYGRGHVSGAVASDVVSISGLSVEDQIFGAATEKSEEFSRDPNNGLLGLAFREIAQTGQPTFFENLVEKKRIPPLFSVYLTRRQKDGSELCFGCTDETKTIGDTVWVPLLSRSYWTVFMNGISVDESRAIDTSLIAAIDTGTSLIYVPDSVADDFYAQIPGSRKVVQFGPNFHSFPCASKIAPSLTFNDYRFTLDLRDFNLGKTGYGSPDCVGGVMALGDLGDNLAIVGAEFIKSWYTTFDYAEAGRIGFSPSINQGG